MINNNNNSIINASDLKFHHMMINNRENLEVTGIKKIESINEKIFVLESIMGYLTLEGESLEVINLNIEKGELSLRGTINSISYNNDTTKVPKAVPKKNESFLSKLFK